MSSPLLCRLTVALDQKPVGTLVEIDPTDTWMKVYLRKGLVVPVIVEAPPAAPDAAYDDAAAVDEVTPAPETEPLLAAPDAPQEF